MAALALQQYWLIADQLPLPMIVKRSWSGFVLVRLMCFYIQFTKQQIQRVVFSFNRNFVYCLHGEHT